jgi:acylphosphatase
MIAKHVIVHGRVQGVFYRAGAQRRADELGVAGWVRNLDDGTVEMVVEGEADAVDRMVSWAGDGPMQAEVSGLDVDDLDPQGLDGFAADG